eukprot:15327302-Ditylum_brightwellii.AAC.1
MRIVLLESDDKEVSSAVDRPRFVPSKSTEELTSRGEAFSLRRDSSYRSNSSQRSDRVLRRGSSGRSNSSRRSDPVLRRDSSGRSNSSRRSDPLLRRGSSGR